MVSIAKNVSFMSCVHIHKTYKQTSNKTGIRQTFLYYKYHLRSQISLRFPGRSRYKVDVQFTKLHEWNKRQLSVWGQGTRYSRCVVHITVRMEQENSLACEVKVQGTVDVQFTTLHEWNKSFAYCVGSRCKVQWMCSSQSCTNGTRDQLMESRYKVQQMCSSQSCTSGTKVLLIVLGQGARQM